MGQSTASARATGTPATKRPKRRSTAGASVLSAGIGFLGDGLVVACATNLSGYSWSAGFGNRLYWVHRRICGVLLCGRCIVRGLWENLACANDAIDTIYDGSGGGTIGFRGGRCRINGPRTSTGGTMGITDASTHT